MQHSILRTEALLRLDPANSTRRWHGLFLEAGLLGCSGLDATPGSPQQALGDARDHLLSLQALEDALARASAPVGGFGNHAPIWAYIAVLAVPVISWQLSALGQTAEDQLMAFGWGVWSAGAIAMAGMAWVVGLERKARRVQRERVAALEARIHSLRRALGPVAARALARSFVARSGPRLLVSTPHRIWLKRAGAAARASIASLPDRAAATRSLAAELEEAAGDVDAAVQRLMDAPPDDWSDAGLVPDLSAWEERLEALEVPPDELCLALAEAWAATT
jgi:hypothetical protein